MERKSFRHQRAAKRLSPVKDVSEKHVIPYELIKDNESKTDRIKCSYCCKLFSTVQEHQRHKCRKANGFLLKCLLCKRRYVDHCFGDGAEKIPSLEEQYPGEQTSTDAVGARSVTKSSYECCHCHKTYPDISSAVRHIKYHAQRKATACEPALDCGQCGKSFTTKQQLTKHGTVHTDVRAFKCQECDKWFKTLDNVRRHMYVHNDARPFACPTCGKQFRARHMLKKHEETHNEERLYECPECQKKYKARNSLRDHRRTHSGQRPYKCQQCDQAFYRRSHLATHKLVHSKVKAHCCKDCGKRFGRREHLKVHERIHSGEKPFACSLCDRSFNQQAGLQAHLMSHSEDRPYACAKCRKTFKYPSQVKHHACKLELSMVVDDDQRGSSGTDREESSSERDTMPPLTQQEPNNPDLPARFAQNPASCLTAENTIVLIQFQDPLVGPVIAEGAAEIDVSAPNNPESSTTGSAEGSCGIPSDSCDIPQHTDSVLSTGAFPMRDLTSGTCEGCNGITSTIEDVME